MAKEAADSTDLDGFIFVRQIPLQAGALKARRRDGVLTYEREVLIPSIERSVDPTRIRSVKEAISFFFHSRRGIQKGVVEALAKRDTDKFGNTGRPNKQRWVEMTWAALQKANIPDLQDVFFTPKGIETIISKGAGIQELLSTYDHVTHFDDDPLTVFILAKHFKEVDFVLLKDRSAGYLLAGVGLKDYENVRVIEKPEEI